ncbi:MAG: GAF domain-containing protein [Desulfobacterales bacterium]|nr:GAF domain-containing protein [Desulfobacterales bacterium]
MITFILALSIFLQFTAAVMSARLIPLTGRKIAWSLISASLVFMALRRGITFVRLVSGDVTFQPDLIAELVALAISFLMVIGISRIAPIFIAHKQTEKELRRVNRALRALSECNQTLIRANEESDLLHGVCRIIVKVGGYHLAWVGFAEQDEAKTVRPVAQAGYEKGYLDTINITWADTKQGRGPTGTAIRSGTPVTARHILTDPDFEPWREAALKHGYASSVALPMIANGQTLGALNVYSSEPDAFNAEEIKLLNKLADNLAFGMIALRTRTKRLQAEKELSIHRDHLEKLVTERTRQLEEKAEKLDQANIRLQELDHLKSMFIASMSHELRTPLNSIIGFTGIILQGMTGEINSEQRDQLQRVYGSAKHLLALISDVIDISKIEAGKVDVHVEEFDLEKVIKEAVSSLKPEIDNKGLDLEINLPPNLQLKTDRKRLLQCVLNFLSNAVKFTEKGKIEITAREVDERTRDERTRRRPSSNQGAKRPIILRPSLSA